MRRNFKEFLSILVVLFFVISVNGYSDSLNVDLVGKPADGTPRDGFIEKGKSPYFQERFHQDNDVKNLEINGRNIPIRYQKGSSISEKATETIKSVIKDDFLVNDDISGGCEQDSPSIAIDGSGNFVICWEDERNSDLDIYCQRFDSSGNTIGVNIRVNDDASIYDQINSCITIDDLGNFIISWQDERNGDLDIYCQRFDSSGNSIGVNIKVNDDIGMNNQEHSSITMSDSGNFIISWQDERNGDWDIYCQRFDSSGNPIGANIKVNNDIVVNNQEHSFITMSDTGNFIISWEDYRNGDWDIYCQRFDSAGNTQGSNIKVNDDIGGNNQEHSSITMSDTGNFIISWEDYRNGDWDIYCQRYDSAGNTQGSNIKVNDDSGTSKQSYPSIGTDSNGNFVISWQDYRNSSWYSDIYCQRYDSAGNTIDANITVNDDIIGWNNQEYPSLAMNSTGNFIISWFDNRNEAWNGDIYYQRYDSAGTTQGSNCKVNDDIGSSFQWTPAIAMDSSGNFIVTWWDNRNGNWGDIYCQRYDSIGNLLGANFKVNEDLYFYSMCPDIAINDSDNFVISWSSYNFWDGYFDVYCQRYDSAGNTQSANIKVNDDAGSSAQWYSSIAMDSSGNFVITWFDNRNGDYDIYYQKYDSAGNTQGANIKVNDDIGTNKQYYPSIAMDNSGNFVISWMDYRNGDWDIYCQRYDSIGNTQAANIKVNDDTGSSDQWNPSITMDDSGNFIISWDDKRNGNWDIYCQRYDSAGNTIGSNIRVNDDIGTGDQWLSSITMSPDGTRFVIYWSDLRNADGDLDIMAQVFKNGVKLGGNVQISNDLFPYHHQWAYTFSLACNNNQIGFTWMDNRRHKCDDIYGKLIDWQEFELPPTNFNENLNNLIVYPNPYVKTSGISNVTFANLTENAKIQIYTISGNLIFEVEADNIEYQWNIKNKDDNDIASGVYIYYISDDKGNKKIGKIAIIR